MRIAAALLFVIALGQSARAEPFPEWAYPPVPQIPVSTAPELLHVPGSELAFTQGQIDGGYGVADWYPGEHAPMPQIVSHGAQPPVRACAMCHLPTGAGHPETNGLAGLPVEYFIEQMTAFVSGARTGPKATSMVPIASGMTAGQVRESAEYFAALTRAPWTRVQESAEAPQTYLGFGAMRYRQPGGGMEPLGSRIISVPEDDMLAARRDSHIGFVSFVPPGSVARGKALVDGRLDGIACAACHGPALQGSGAVPGLTGRLPLATYRALNDIKTGMRTTPGALAMRPAVAELGTDDMIAISAYLGSLPP